MDKIAPHFKKRALYLSLWFVASLGTLLAIVYGFFLAVAGNDRSIRLSIAKDQVVNVSCGGNEDETISSRTAKEAALGKWPWTWLRAFLNWIDPKHCEKVVELDRGNEQITSELRAEVEALRNK